MLFRIIRRDRCIVVCKHDFTAQKKRRPVENVSSRENVADNATTRPKVVQVKGKKNGKSFSNEENNHVINRNGVGRVETVAVH